MSCGLGGDLFAIVWVAAEKKLYGLNASGRSPAGLSLRDMRKRAGRSIPVRGPLSVSVPGCVDGWFELHKRFGKLPMAAVLAPTIAYAREGVPVPQIIARYWSGAGSLKDQPDFAGTFLPGGRPPRVGEIFKNPDLAGVLETIAQGGRDAFYRGPIARTIDAFCRRVDCPLRYQDLAEHTSTWVDPVSVNYRGHDIWELPPNGQGIAALQMLRILEPFDLRAMGHNSAEYLHHLIEAKKLAFEDRARFYADPVFNYIPVARLISEEYAAQRRAHIDPAKASVRLPADDPISRQGDTIYLTVADTERNMVSLIQSTFYGFGSGLVPGGLGFTLQNRGALFCLEDGHYNCYAPRKRPFHTIIPAFVTKEEKPVMSFGVMGGDMQPQGHLQVLLNILEFGMNLQEAGDAPRFRHLGSSSPRGDVMTDGGAVALESGIPEAVRAVLREKGHRLVDRRGGFGGYQAIRYDEENDVYRAASESRKDGMAAGY
jgi:gamma-glutamyltranspeptidase/glutathione hydrolase